MSAEVLARADDGASTCVLRHALVWVASRREICSFGETRRWRQRLGAGIRRAPIENVANGGRGDEARMVHATEFPGDSVEAASSFVEIDNMLRAGRRASESLASSTSTAMASAPIREPSNA